MRTSYHPQSGHSSAVFAPIPDHVCASRVRQAAHALGGTMNGPRGRVPAPGKPPSNASMVLFPNPNVRFGVGIHDHTGSGQELAVRQEIAARLGWDDGAPIVRDWTPERSVIGQHVGFPSQSAKQAATEVITAERCKSLWNETHDTGEPLLSYLLGTRGLSASSFGEGICHVIRLHPDLPFWQRDGEKPDGSPRYSIAFRSPCMIARITDCENGKTIGLHRTWLTDDGRKHPLAGSNARKMKGRAKGGAVALGKPDASGLIAVTEGIESAMALQELMGVGTHAALSAVGMSAWTPPQGTRAVLIAHDDDKGGQGKAAADALALRLAAMGIDSRHYPPGAAHRAFIGCNDWNDALLGHQMEGAA